jgi:hypothetical protein
MDLVETEARNDCAGEGQQQFNWLSDREFGGRSRKLVVMNCIVSSQYLATISEQTQDFLCLVFVVN